MALYAAKRGRHHLTFGDSLVAHRRIAHLMMTPIHYATDGPDSDNYTTPINATPKRVETSGYDGWKVTANGWHYGLGKPWGKTNDGWVGFGGRSGQHWLWSRLARVGYLRQGTRAWQDIGGAPSYNRANLSISTDELSLGPETLYPESLTTWEHLWSTPSGGDLSIRYKCSGRGLKEEILINQAGRDWIRINRPPLTPVAQTWFGFVFQLDLSNIPGIYKNAIAQNLQGDFDDSDGIPFGVRDAAQRLLAFMPVDNLYVMNGQEVVAQTPLRKRLWRDPDGNHYLLVGVGCSVMAGLPSGDLVFDPTYSSQPDATAGIDTYLREVSGDAFGDVAAALNLCPIATNRRNGLLKFDLSSITAGSTINSGTFRTWNGTTATATRAYALYRILAANSGWTEAGACWNYAVWNTIRWAGDAAANGGTDAGCSQSGTDYAAAELGTFSYIANNAADTEHVVTLSTTEIASMLAANYGFVWRQTDAVTGTQDFRASDYTTDTTKRPKLEIDYTEPGGAAVEGAAVLAGVGSLASAGVRAKTGASVLAGVGSIAAAGSGSRPGAAVLAGTGTLAAASIAQRPGAVVLAGVGAVAADGEVVGATQGAIVLAGVSTLAAAAVVLKAGAAVLAGVGSIDGAPVFNVTAAAVLAGTSSLRANTSTFLGTGWEALLMQYRPPV